MNATWSWKLFRVAGIDVSVHLTFILLLGLFLMQGIGAAVTLLLVFGCVLLHELGHALAARLFGIETHGITLLPIGGVAALERMPRKPFQELIIAAAGPAVNVVLAAILFPLAMLTAGVETLTAFSLGSSVLANLFLVNCVLVVFNLLPAFPMDGGRILRALLAMRMPYVRATRIAAKVGQVAAVLLGLVGLFTLNPILVLIAIFVYSSAGREAQIVERLDGRQSHQEDPFHRLNELLRRSFESGGRRREPPRRERSTGRDSRGMQGAIRDARFTIDER